MIQLPKLGLLVLLVTMTSDAFAEDTQNLSKSELSATIGVVNKYIYRGGEESDDPSVQFGLEYTYNSRIFLCYWGSTLNYNSSDANQDHGFEHDFYIGYGRALNENWSYKSQIVS
ncbi:TorF family putative porin [Acinetobacter schindleri]|uniref:TorF family putative porin n=1 Tax=Acinetobacter schindleri TaxID=108981 RepID=UPI002FDCCEA2